MLPAFIPPVWHCTLVDILDQGLDKWTYHHRHADACLEMGHSHWIRASLDAGRSYPCLSHLAASAPPSCRGPSSAAYPPWGCRCCCAVSGWCLNNTVVVQKENIRSVVIHGCRPLKVGLVTVGHCAVSHHLVLRVHRVVHHHALVSLLILQLAEVLRGPLVGCYTCK